MMDLLPSLNDVKKRRLKLGLTQIELAKLSNVSQSLIAKIETNKIDPSYSKIKNVLYTLENLENKEMMKAKDIVSKEFIYVKKDELVSKATSLMRKHNISQLPVLAGDVVVGSITERTILNKIVSGDSGEELAKKRIEELMEDPFPVVGENSSLSVVSNLLKYNSAVIVIKKNEKLGIITKSDLLKTISK